MISRYALDKNPMPGHLFEGNPVDEGTTQRGTDTLVHRLEKPAGSTYSSTSGLTSCGSLCDLEPPLVGAWALGGQVTRPLVIF